MNAVGNFMRCSGTTDRLRYQRNVAAFGIAKALLDLLVLAVEPGVAIDLIVMSWFNPYLLVGPWLTGGFAWTICATTIIFFLALVWNAVHRLRDAGWAPWLGLTVAMPYAGTVAALLCCFLPTRKHTVWDLV